MTEATAIRIQNLSKTYGRGRKAVEALKDLNLEIEAGQVYGFLGPNGAGKTTTIRVLMDLIRPTQGSVHLFERNPRRQPEILKRVGAIVETPAFYDHLSGRDNLVVLADTANDRQPGRIEVLLEQVGLSEKANRRTGTYSTGMKQRLALAAALLNDPDLLILDEPTSGLDPAGITEMRQFIRRLVDDDGKTVFLSSHILHEVEQVCDRVAIIHEGECVGDGRVSELLAEDSGTIRLQVRPLDQAAAVLSGSWDVEVEGDWLSVKARPDIAPTIIDLLVSLEIGVFQVIAKHQSLEEFFMKVTESGAVPGPSEGS